LLSLTGLAISILLLQALLFTAFGPLPETARDNTVTTLAAYLPAPSSPDSDRFLPRGAEAVRRSLSQAVAGQQVKIVDFYAGFSRQSLTRGDQSIELELTGLTGRFEDLHSLTLLSGSFLPDDPVWTRHFVVLDEWAAWQLFGALDIAGMDLQIQGRPFTVGGVVRLPRTWQDQLSREDQPQAFVHFSTLQLLDPQASITAYEVRLPEPVPGMGRSFFREALALSGQPADRFLTVEHQPRLAPFNLLMSWREVGQRAIVSGLPVLPWWENKSRAAADLASLLILTAAACLIVLAMALYAQRLLEPVRWRRLAWQMVLTSAASGAAALFLIHRLGQLVPVSRTLLATLYALITGPVLLLLLFVAVATIRSRIPDRATAMQWLKARTSPIQTNIQRHLHRLHTKKERSS
jgi:hypothetical protein